MFQYPFRLDSYFYTIELHGKYSENGFQYPFRLDSYFYAEEIAKEKAEAEFQYPFRLDSYFYTMVATDIWREHVSIPFQVRFLFLQKAMKKINNFLGVSIPFQVRFLFLLRLTVKW